jgi:biotin carboxylase
VVLILPTGTYRAPDFVQAAAAIGAEVVVASERPQAMRRAMGDRALVVNLCDPAKAAAAIVERAKRHPVDAVVAVDESGVVAAALAGAQLGLAHNPPEAVMATRDKARLRACLAAAGVPQPAYTVVGPGDDLAGAALALGLPVVVKPVALSASRGVIRADDAAAAVAAGERVRSILAAADEDPNGPLLIERFVPGAEIAVEGLLRDGALEVLAFFDKPDPLDGPFFEETIYVTPSRHSAATLGVARSVLQTAVAALGLREGPIHAELRVADDSAWLLEVAARSIGGLCSRALRFGAGISLEELVLRHALGLPTQGLQREAEASGVMMIPIPATGRLIAVSGAESASAVAGVVGLTITVPLGRTVEALPEGDRYLGFIYAKAGTPADVEAALRQAHSRLDVRIDEGVPTG